GSFAKTGRSARAQGARRESTTAKGFALPDRTRRSRRTEQRDRFAARCRRTNANSGGGFYFDQWTSHRQPVAPNDRNFAADRDSIPRIFRQNRRDQAQRLHANGQGHYG